MHEGQIPELKIIEFFSLAEFRETTELTETQTLYVYYILLINMTDLLQRYYFTFLLLV